MSYTFDFEWRGTDRQRGTMRRRLDDLRDRYAFTWSETPWPGAIAGATFYLQGDVDVIAEVRRELQLPGDRVIE